MASKDEMKLGESYRVVFTDENGDDQEFVAAYLGEGASATHDFDLQPAAGTMSVPVGSLKSFKKTKDGERARKPRKTS